MKDDTGYIKLFRKIDKWEWYDDPPTKVVFIHCLLKANFKEKTWRGKLIKPGQFFTSVKHLSHDLGLSEKQIRTALKKLASTGEIETEGASKGTMITVCNYGSYQDQEETKGEQKGNQKANKGRTKGEQRATTYNVKNDKNEKNDKEKGESGGKKDFDLSFVDVALRPLVTEFIRYRKQDIKKPIKTDKGLKTFYNQLLKLSNNNYMKAKELIEHAKGREWQTVYPIKKPEEKQVSGGKNKQYTNEDVWGQDPTSQPTVWG